MRRALPAALVLLLAATAMAGVEELVADLSDPQKRSAALNELRRVKDPAAVPLLVEAVRETTDGLTRYYGVLVLDAYPPEVGRRAFATLVREEDPWLRLASAAALYRMGERDALPVVAKALVADGVDPATRARMLSRIYGLPGDGIAGAVRSLVRPGEEVIVLASALSWLGSYAPESGRSAVADLLEDPRPGVRGMAAAFLYRHGEEERAALLVDCLATGEVTYTEFIRIQQFLFQASRVAEEILDAVAELAGEAKSTLVVRRCVELLAKFGHRKSIPLLRELLDHEDQQVAKAAFEALTALSGGLNEETLAPMLAADDPMRRLWAAEALRRMDELSGLPVALEVLEDGAPAERIEAVRVVAGFRVPAAVDALLPLLSDPSSAVRSAAFTGLSRILAALFPYRRLNLSTTGYVATAAPAASRAAAETIREWWEANRGKDW